MRSDQPFQIHTHVRPSGSLTKTSGDSIPKKYEKGGSLTVKVQVPMATNDPEPMAMVYNKSRDFQVYMPITPELSKAMDGRLKAFFKAHYDRLNNNTVLEGEAPWQTW